MRLITAQVPKNFNLFLCSCSHWGSSFTHETGWNQMIEMLHSNYQGIPASANYLVHHGDLVEGIAISDKRWYPGNMIDGVIPQIELAVRMLAPIKNKVITLLMGNHEAKLERDYGNITASICNTLGIQYGTYSCRIAYTNKRSGDILFKQFATHGWRGISSVADDPTRRDTNMKLSLKRTLSPMAGDTVLMTKGHTHRLLVREPFSELYLTDDGNKIKQAYTNIDQAASFIPIDLRWYVNVGAFYKMYYENVTDFDYQKPVDGVRSSYPERYEYAPIELGFAVATIRDGKITNVVKEIME